MPRLKFLFILFLTLIFAVSCSDSNRIYHFNFHKKWHWTDLEKNAGDPRTRQEIRQLKELLSIDDARFLLREISELHNPAQIKNLYGIQHLQKKLGGDFYGVIPDQLDTADTIPVPDNFGSLIRSALFLAQKRAGTLAAIEKTPYPLNFKNGDFPEMEAVQSPASMKLELDLSGMEALLKVFQKDTVQFEEAMRIAGLPVFTEMLKHRRNLGYIPEPIANEESLARFIQYSVSRKPLAMIWKWMNPWNYFNLADISLNLEKYEKTINSLQKHKQQIENEVMGRIALFAPDSIQFQEQFGIGVNWGIRGWAAEKTSGMNIVYFKDDYSRMLQTITHEIYHRLQLREYPVDDSLKEKSPRTFEDLYAYRFPGKKDRRFYQTLTLIYLEGSASYVGGIDSSRNVVQHAAEGMNLLNEIYRQIYVKNDFDAAERLENQGLRSNGPFYDLGYFMTEKIVAAGGTKKMGNLLRRGSMEFFMEYNKFLNAASNDTIPEILYPKGSLVKKLEDLYGLFRRN
ncbi:MAG: hypothetical protein P8184_07865 [Calditrichia bacterium]